MNDRAAPEARHRPDRQGSEDETSVSYKEVSASGIWRWIMVRLVTAALVWLCWWLLYLNWGWLSSHPEYGKLIPLLLFFPGSFAVLWLGFHAINALFARRVFITLTPEHMTVTAGMKTTRYDVAKITDLRLDYPYRLRYSTILAPEGERKLSKYRAIVLGYDFDKQHDLPGYLRPRTAEQVHGRIYKFLKKNAGRQHFTPEQAEALARETLNRRPRV